MQRQGLSEALPLSPTSRFFYSSSLYTRFKYSARSSYRFFKEKALTLRKLRSYA